MHSELKHVIELVQNSTDPVHLVVERYFASVKWTELKDEYENRMTDAQRKTLLHKLRMLRHAHNEARRLSEQTRGKKK